MKKKTIATSLLAILVSTYAVPFVSNAEGTQATTSTTEVVAEQSTEDTTGAPTDVSTEESSEEILDNNESSEVTKETSEENKVAVRTPGEPTKENDVQEVNPADEPLTRGTATTDENREKFEDLIRDYGAGKATDNLIQKYVDKLYTVTTEASMIAIYDEFVRIVDNKGLEKLKEDYRVELEAKNEKVGASITTELGTIKSADTEGIATNAYLNALKKIEEKANKDAEVIRLKKQAVADVKSHYDKGEITASDVTTWTNNIESSTVTTPEQVQAQLDAFHAAFPKLDNHDVLTPAPEDSSAPAGSDSSAPAGSDSSAPAGSDSSAPAGSDSSAPAGSDSSAVTPTDDKSLEEAKDEARRVLSKWYEEGKLTTNEFVGFLADVDNAKTKEEVAGVVAKAKALIDSRKAAVVVNTVTKVEKVSANKDATKATNNANQLPKTGESANNLTALGLMSVALGSLAVAFKRKKS